MPIPPEDCDGIMCPQCMPDGCRFPMYESYVDEILERGPVSDLRVNVGRFFAPGSKVEIIATAKGPKIGTFTIADHPNPGACMDNVIRIVGGIPEAVRPGMLIFSRGRG